MQYKYVRTRTHTVQFAALTNRFCLFFLVCRLLCTCAIAIFSCFHYVRDNVRFVYLSAGQMLTDMCLTASVCWHPTDYTTPSAPAASNVTFFGGCVVICWIFVFKIITLSLYIYTYVSIYVCRFVCIYVCPIAPSHIHTYVQMCKNSLFVVSFLNVCGVSFFANNYKICTGVYLYIVFV